jgi:phosphomannomutase
MKPLKIGITGVRGIVGETLTPELIVQFAQAFGTYLDGGKVLVCRDTRPSGAMVRAGVMAGLLAAGCEVVDLDIVPTPTMQLAVKHFGARGGISITAGHNPAEWNALKFVRGDGLYLNATQAEELLDLFHQGEFTKARWDKIATRVAKADALAPHLEVLQRSFDVVAVRQRKLIVAVDCCNGACANLSPRWLAALGCEVLALNDDPCAPFPHAPEPKRDTMAQLRAVVKAGRADLGLAHDADGERLGLVTETGEILSEEMTLTLATAIRLSTHVGTVVTNVSTTQAIDALACRHSSQVIRTPVGTAYIAEAILENAAVLGGEGNGAVAVPEVQPTHDSAATIGLLLEHLVRSGQTVSQLVAQLPRFTMRKRYVSVAPNLLFSVLHDFRKCAESSDADALDTSDGIKLQWANRWLHVRASNTESMIRVIAEAEDVAQADALIDWALDGLR